jgi:sorbitol-specific phosphotransferase system component IIA
MTPASNEGQKAYQSLIELGFVETPFAGAKSAK